MIKILSIILSIAVLALIIWRAPENGWASLIWVASMFALTAIRAPFEAEKRKNTIVEKRKGQLEKGLLMGVGVGMLYLPMLHLVTGLFWFAEYRLPLWFVGLGIILLIPSYWLFWRSHADLGRNWSQTLEMKEGHRLVTAGVYKRVRHPMYAALWLICMTQPFFVQNWIAGFSGVAAFGLLYFMRVPHEERMMQDHFGSDYAEYKRNSGKLFPPLNRTG